MTKGKKPIWKGHILCDSNYATVWKRQNYGDSKRSAVTRCRRAEIGEWGEMDRQSTEDFQGSETTLYGIMMMDICHYTFVEIHKMYNTKGEL